MLGTQFHNCGQCPGVVTLIPTEGTFHGTGRELPLWEAHSELRSTLVNIIFSSCFSKNKISIYISLFYLTGFLGNTLDLLLS